MCLFHYILCLSPLFSPSSSSSQSKARNVYEMMRLTFLPNAHCNCQKYFYNDKKTNTPTVTNKATDGGFSKKKKPRFTSKKKKSTKKHPSKDQQGSVEICSFHASFDFRGHLLQILTKRKLALRSLSS